MVRVSYMKKGRRKKFNGKFYTAHRYYGVGFKPDAEKFCRDSRNAGGRCRVVTETVLVPRYGYETRYYVYIRKTK